MAEHPVLDFVPLAGSGREVGRRHLQPEFVGALLQSTIARRFGRLDNTTRRDRETRSTVSSPIVMKILNR